MANPAAMGKRGTQARRTGIPMMVMARAIVPTIQMGMRKNPPANPTTADRTGAWRAAVATTSSRSRWK